jgi:ribosomal protein L11 methyltransferase
MTGRRWLVLTVRVPSEELTDELTEGLLALGGTAVEEWVDLLTTYVPEPPDAEAFLRSAADRLGGIAGGEPELIWSWQEDEDWSRRWKEGLAPKRVGRRLVVTQPWNPVDPEPGDLVIEIDPSTAFGTGEHATTRGALRLMESFLQGGESVLDVGTGSAILAIAAVKLGAGRVLAVESDEGSMETARENLERNGAAHRVELVHDRVDLPYLEREREAGFDLIAANVLSSVLIPLLPGFADALRPDGPGGLILGGILAGEAPAVRAAAEGAGFRVEREDREQEWWTGLFQRAHAGR